MIQKRLLSIVLIALCLIAAEAQKKIKVACIGNSVTAGYLLSDRAQESYPSVLQRLLGDRYEVGNFGHSGATLLAKGHKPYIQTEEYRKALAFDADIFIIHLGLNDTDPRNWPNYREEFEADYYRLINSLTKQDTTKRILIARMSPITTKHHRFASSTHTWYKQINNAISTVARHAHKGKAELLDLSKPLKNYPNLLPDALHPNAEGAEKLARYIYSHISGDFGGLQMSSYYSNGMIIQRADTLTFSGICNRDEDVTIKVNGTTPETFYRRPDGEGRWELGILMRDLPQGLRHQIEISTPKRTLTFTDVAIGDVWLASGQSNMSWTLSNTKDYDRHSTKIDPNLRFYDMRPIAETDSRAWGIDTLDRVNNLTYFRQGKWTNATDTEAMNQWSAVAYHFARMMRDQERIPIAIVHNALGGAPIESFVSRETIEDLLPDMIEGWTKKDYSQDWVRQRAMENIANRPEAQRHPYDPGYLYAQAIEPLEGIRFKGVLWYQGESNANNLELYTQLFPKMVSDWRKILKPADEVLPFFTVQLPGIASRSSWSHFRITQSDLAKADERIYIIPTYDQADSTDIHPREKKVVGQRLAMQALELEHSGYRRQAVTRIERIVHSHDDKHNSYYELVTSGPHITRPEDAIYKGFEWASTDKQFQPAKVIVHERRQTLMLVFPKGTQPIYVRYAWGAMAKGNLINYRGIPVLPYWTGEDIRLTRQD